MPTNRRYLRRSHRATLTHTQTMELWLGPSHSGSSLENDEHRRAMWFRHRDKLMGWWGKGGRRPQGWWWYESSQFGLHRYPTSQYERSVLRETPGVLGATERADLEREWRVHGTAVGSCMISSIAPDRTKFTAAMRLACGIWRGRTCRLR